MVDDLKIIKKKYGEKMMHLCRELFPSLLEHPGLLSSIMLEHFAENKFLYNDLVNSNQLELLVEGFKNYIYSFVDVENEMKIVTQKSPYELLDEAGYYFYECKTEEEIQSFRKYYANGEELCTFKGNRLDTCYVFFAVKKDVENIRRDNFPNPQREDEYGTSVISIQFRKNPPNTLSIKNRYNHTVNNPDNTFNNNLDNIIPGLNDSFRRTFNYTFDVSSSGLELPGYVWVDGKYYKYMYEINNIYYCYNNIIIDNFTVIDKYSKNSERYIVLDYFVVDLHNKTIELYDKSINDGFVSEFKNISKIHVSKDKERGNKTLTINYDNDKIAVIVFNNNKIIEYSNKYLIEMKDFTLYNVSSLVKIDVPNLKKMNNGCLMKAGKLEKFDAPELLEIGNASLSEVLRLKEINVPKLKKIGTYCLKNIDSLQNFNAPSLEIIGHNCFTIALKLEKFNAPELLKVGNGFMDHANSISVFVAPKLREVGTKHFISDVENFKDYLLSHSSDLSIYIDANNKYVVSNEELDKDNGKKIKKVYVTVKSLLNDLKLIINHGFYKIKDFNKKLFADNKGGYKK